MTRLLSGAALAAAALAAILFLPLSGLRLLACLVAALAGREYLAIIHTGRPVGDGARVAAGGTHLLGTVRSKPVGRAAPAAGRSCVARRRSPVSRAHRRPGGRTPPGTVVHRDAARDARCGARPWWTTSDVATRRHDRCQRFRAGPTPVARLVDGRWHQPSVRRRPSRAPPEVWFSRRAS